MGEFPNPDTQFKPGESGNPKGMAKGTKHISTWIRELLDDENFEQKLEDGTMIKIVPLKAIIQVAIKKAIEGDTRAMDWLAKYGWGSKIELDVGEDFKEVRDDLREMYDVRNQIRNNGNSTDTAGNPES